MKRMTRMQALLAMTVLAIGATGIAVADHGGSNGGANTETRLRTRLAGAAIQGITPEGNADFRSEPGKTRSRLNVEVEHVNLPAGTMLDVSLVHGTTTTALGQIKLSALGFGELELNSQDGTTVPAVQTGDMVTVSNAGKTILAGVF